MLWELDDMSSYPEVFFLKGVLKICNKFTGEHPCWNVISIKLLCNFIEITLWHGCSLVNLLHIFRTSFSKNSSEEVVQDVRYDVSSSVVFLPYFSILTLSLPLLELGSKSTSLRSGFCVRSSRHYDRIFW